MTEGSCYFEWSAEGDADPGDPETWRSCMPALGSTVTEDVVRSDFDSMALSEFSRAYLNRWMTSHVDPVIPLDVWADLRDPDSYALDPVTFAFDVTPDRSRAAIAVAGARDDGAYARRGGRPSPGHRVSRRAPGSAGEGPVGMSTPIGPTVAIGFGPTPESPGRCRALTARPDVPGALRGSGRPT